MVVVVGFSGGGASFVVDSGALDCSVEFGLLARAGLKISTPSKVRLAFLRLKSLALAPQYADLL
jgi:hypothetical protein